MNTNEKEVALMNKIIRAAIWYGADIGGAYRQEEDVLRNEINAWLIFKGLDKDYFVGEGEHNWLTIKKI